MKIIFMVDIYFNLYWSTVWWTWKIKYFEQHLCHILCTSWTHLFINIMNDYHKSRLTFLAYPESLVPLGLQSKMSRERERGWLCFTFHRQQGHLETTTPFTVPCEGHEEREKNLTRLSYIPGFIQKPTGGKNHPLLL